MFTQLCFSLHCLYSAYSHCAGCTLGSLRARQSPTAQPGFSLILTTCQICYHSHLCDHRSTGQLWALILRGCLEYQVVSRISQIMLVWTKNKMREEAGLPAGSV